MPDTHEAITRLLESKSRIDLAYLFGSLARGSAHSGSDLDLAVLARPSLSVEERIALIENLAGLLGRPVDLVDLTVCGGPLLGEILRHGIQVKGSSSDHAEWVSRHLGMMEDFYPYVQRMLKERRESWIG
ncbi:nucleotidyltransferase domain-containing protein [Haliea sp. E1-2-M8]|uniref:type VII toxin-antitoxin system MntA family adenylyltransferase antitoxin n=1 Tax=Haliea sp. E1-2-M8 TaxID=3064706 RepID=UPI0027258EE3|nr:nucleotidyltransferase domain-containing protein [Haliea sp. E1-2-M8]MDO8863489.1 nucleotidyltransferase domain-containing protein [Haliea sp. E1-2-M8]